MDLDEQHRATRTRWRVPKPRPRWWAAAAAGSALLLTLLISIAVSSLALTAVIMAGNSQLINAYEQRQGELEAAADAGVVVQIGEWVLAGACAQIAARRTAGEQVGLLVSCSARQVTRQDFVRSVLSALSAAGLEPHALTVQVGERLLVDDGEESAVAALAELRATGVRLAIDGFGTGYASLANLGQLPVDVIKIAPSFIAELGSDSRLNLLTKTIIELGEELGIEVIASGVEDAGQRDHLISMGCKLGQGSALRWQAGGCGEEAGSLGASRSAIPTGPASRQNDR